MYKENSPWSKTNIIDDTILDLITHRSLYPDPYDVIYTIPAKYEERPDLCSYEIGGFLPQEILMI